MGDAARAAVRTLSREHIDTLAARLAAGASAAGMTDAVALSACHDAAGRLVAAIDATGVDRMIASAHQRALAEGYALGRAGQRVEVVWSGPTSSACG